MFIFIYLLDYIFKHENVDQARLYKVFRSELRLFKLTAIQTKPNSGQLPNKGFDLFSFEKIFCLFRVIFQFHYDDEIVPLLKIDPLLIFPLQLEVPLLVNVPLGVIPLLVVPLLWIPLLLTPLPLACKSPCWAM